jgi:hypothetical protein
MRTALQESEHRLTLQARIGTLISILDLIVSLSPFSKRFPYQIIRLTIAIKNERFHQLRSPNCLHGWPPLCFVGSFHAQDSGASKF